MRAEKVVAALLGADVGVAALVAQKIFFCVAEERTPAPLVVFRKQGATRDNPSQNPPTRRVNASIEVMCIATTGEQLLQLGEAVRVALFNRVGDNIAGTGVKVFELEIESESEQQYSPDLREFSQLWTFTVQHLEP